MTQIRCAVVSEGGGASWWLLWCLVMEVVGFGKKLDMGYVLIRDEFT